MQNESNPLIPVKVFNNLDRKKELLNTITPGEVRFYSCGPTTYDFLHVGNARAMVVGDLIHRILKSLGYKVSFVRNFTDVDDKIIDRARELGVDPLVHSAKYVEECLIDMDSLGMLPATHTPKVSETMPEIIQMIEDLIKNDYAYEVNGEVYYHVPKFKDYGKLSKKDLESLQHGIRVEVDSQKKHPSDFVLWKPAKENESCVWDSPWGKGRPGWHIECSAMSKKFLGKTLDLHHGGVDLMFPHHENEIAQSEAANGCCFSRNWVHNEFLNFGKEKMSKSLGNVVTIRKFVETYGGSILRQVLASVHYRSKMEWSEEVIQRAVGDVERLHLFSKKIMEMQAGEVKLDLSMIAQVKVKMEEELANDFNVPGAMAHYFSLIRLVNRECEKANPTANALLELKAVIDFVEKSTGLVRADYADVLKEVDKARASLSGSAQTISEEQIEQYIEDRRAARASKDWKRADQIRDELSAAGIVLKDNPDGTVSWSHK